MKLGGQGFQFTHQSLQAIALLREQIGVELQPLYAGTPIIGIHRTGPVHAANHMPQMSNFAVGILRSKAPCCRRFTMLV